MLDAVALRLTEGYAAAAPALNRALKMVLALDVSSGEAGYWLWLAGGRISQIIAMELWDFESWHALAVSQVQFSRERGALTHLTFALNYLARAHILAGELATAARLVEEDHLIAEATGNPPIAYTEMMLAAWRGQEQEASGLVEAISREAAARDVGRLASLAAYASSVLHNGLGQHDAACDAARLAFEREPMGLGSHIVPELAEAAARTGDVALVEAAMEWLSERTRVTPTEWVLGIEARVRALLCDGDAAESCYRESIERLGRTRVRAHLARAHLLYGEWLRRKRRRGEAREQLRTAYEMLDAMGIGAFAERARRELRATGETARKRTIEHTVELTAQEAQVAGLARDGLSNPEIGARLFISTRTVQYHLGKVFTKLGISSRSQLYRALQVPDTDLGGRSSRIGQAMLRSCSSALHMPVLLFVRRYETGPVTEGTCRSGNRRAAAAGARCQRRLRRIAAAARGGLSPRQPHPSPSLRSAAAAASRQVRRPCNTGPHGRRSRRIIGLRNYWPLQNLAWEAQVNGLARRPRRVGCGWQDDGERHAAPSGEMPVTVGPPFLPDRQPGQPGRSPWSWPARPGVACSPLGRPHIRHGKLVP